MKNWNDFLRRFIVVSLTRKCPLNCKHCLVGGSHNKDLSTDKLTFIIKNLANSKKFQGVAFTGGEPFYVFQKLKAAIELAKANDLRTGVVTSGYWAVNPAKTRKILESLDGLEVLMVSVDKFHQEKVPLKNIEYILAAAKDLGIATCLKIILNKWEIHEDPGLKICQKYSCDFMVQNLILSGVTSKEPLIGELKYNKFYGRKFCSSTAPFINEDGNAFYCCGPMGFVKKIRNLLYLGHIYEGVVGDFNAKKRRRIQRFLGQEIVPFIKKLRENKVKLPGNYSNVCDLCHDLFTLNRNNEYVASSVK